MECLLKVLIVGDVKVGKTSFVSRYVHDTFDDKYKVTIGVDFALKEIFWHDHRKIKIQLWDIAGQERYTSMTRVYYKESNGCIIMFDLTDRNSFLSVLKWKKDLDNKCMFADGKPVPCILLANKSDLKNHRVIDESEIENLCKENHFIGWSEVSVKDNSMLQSSVDCLIENILERQRSYDSSDLLDDRNNGGNNNIIYSIGQSGEKKSNVLKLFSNDFKSSGTGSQKDGCSC